MRISKIAALLVAGSISITMIGCGSSSSSSTTTSTQTEQPAQSTTQTLAEVTGAVNPDVISLGDDADVRAGVTANDVGAICNGTYVDGYFKKEGDQTYFVVDVPEDQTCTIVFLDRKYTEGSNEASDATVVAATPELKPTAKNVTLNITALNGGVLEVQSDNAEVLTDTTNIVAAIVNKPLTQAAQELVQATEQNTMTEENTTAAEENTTAEANTTTAEAAKAVGNVDQGWLDKRVAGLGVVQKYVANDTVAKQNYNYVVSDKYLFSFSGSSFNALDLTNGKKITVTTTGATMPTSSNVIGYDNTDHVVYFNNGTTLYAAVLPTEISNDTATVNVLKTTTSTQSFKFLENKVVETTGGNSNAATLNVYYVDGNAITKKTKSTDYNALPLQYVNNIAGTNKKIEYVTIQYQTQPKAVYFYWDSAANDIKSYTAAPANSNDINASGNLDFKVVDFDDSNIYLFTVNGGSNASNDGDANFSVMRMPKTGGTLSVVKFFHDISGSSLGSGSIAHFKVARDGDNFLIDFNVSLNGKQDVNMSFVKVKSDWSGLEYNVSTCGMSTLPNTIDPQKITNIGLVNGNVALLDSNTGTATQDIAYMAAVNGFNTFAAPRYIVGTSTTNNIVVDNNIANTYDNNVIMSVSGDKVYVAHGPSVDVVKYDNGSFVLDGYNTTSSAVVTSQSGTNAVINKIKPLADDYVLYAYNNNANVGLAKKTTNGYVPFNKTANGDDVNITIGNATNWTNLTLGKTVTNSQSLIKLNTEDKFNPYWEVLQFNNTNNTILPTNDTNNYVFTLNNNNFNKIYNYTDSGVSPQLVTHGFSDSNITKVLAASDKVIVSLDNSNNIRVLKDYATNPTEITPGNLGNVGDAAVSDDKIYVTVTPFVKTLDFDGNLLNSTEIRYSLPDAVDEYSTPSSLNIAYAGNYVYVLASFKGIATKVEGLTSTVNKDYVYVLVYKIDGDKLTQVAGKQLYSETVSNTTTSTTTYLAKVIGEGDNAELYVAYADKSGNGKLAEISLKDPINLQVTSITDFTAPSNPAKNIRFASTGIYVKSSSNNILRYSVPGLSRSVSTDVTINGNWNVFGNYIIADNGSGIVTLYDASNIAKTRIAGQFDLPHYYGLNTNVNDLYMKSDNNATYAIVGVGPTNSSSKDGGLAVIDLITKTVK